jgi:hypothetical protein
MHKFFVFGVLAIAAVALAGCAQLGRDFAAGAQSVASGVNSVAAALSSPAATQAAANLKAGSQATACDFSQVANAVDQIALAVKAGQAIQRDAQTALTISDAVCTAFGGAPMGTVTVPAS